MGLFDRIFRKQPEQDPKGFYIIRYHFGEKEAANLFRRANEGDVDAQMKLADTFYESSNHRYAFEWYEKAAARNNSDAYHKISLYYDGLFTDIEADPAKAAEAREKALALNNVDAILWMGEKYENGKGVNKDPRRSFAYYKKAADLGSKEGMAELGRCYSDGIGVEPDEKKAFEWYVRSDDPYKGYYEVAQCYMHGKGTEPDMQKAAAYLEKAVEANCFIPGRARRELLKLYRLGYGTGDIHSKLRVLEEKEEKSNQLLDELAAMILSEN